VTGACDPRQFRAHGLLVVHGLFVFTRMADPPPPLSEVADNLGRYEFARVENMRVAKFAQRVSGTRMPCCDHKLDCVLHVIMPVNGHARGRAPMERNFLEEDEDEGVRLWAFCACPHPPRERCMKIQWIADAEALATMEKAAEVLSKDKDAERRSREHQSMVAQMQRGVVTLATKVGSQMTTSFATPDKPHDDGIPPLPDPHSHLYKLAQMGVPLTHASNAMDAVAHVGQEEALDWMKEHHSAGGITGCVEAMERKCMSPYCRFCMIISSCISVASLGSIPALNDA